MVLCQLSGLRSQQKEPGWARRVIWDLGNLGFPSRLLKWFSVWLWALAAQWSNCYKTRVLWVWWGMAEPRHCALPIWWQEHGQGLATSIPVSRYPYEGFSRFLPPCSCQGGVVPIILKITKANTSSCCTRQHQWQGTQTFFLPLERSVLFTSSRIFVYNICSFLFQMISDLMTGINSD